MRAFPVVAVVAALLLASVPSFLPQATAREGTLATPNLRERAEDGSRIVEWRGTSSIEVTGFCLPALRPTLRSCHGSHDTEDGRYFLPATAHNGKVIVEWRAVNDSLRTLEVTIGGLTLNGTSPLVFDFLGAPVGEYAVHAEPMQIVVGTWTQPLAWEASFRLDMPLRMSHQAGHAGYTTHSGCVLILCDAAHPTLASTSDPLVVPWTASGDVDIDWDLEEGPMRVTVPGTGFVAEGEPPLRLNVDGLRAGEWRFDIRPTDVAVPLSTFVATWSVDLVEHP